MSIEALESQLSDADWASWLVYGDWLLAQGDVRGELIRLEHEHALAPKDNARKRRLHNEVRALTRQHEASWRTGLPPDLTVAWKHGFITSLWLPWLEDVIAALPDFLSGPNGRLLTTLAFEWRGVPERAALRATLSRVGALSSTRVMTLSCAYVPVQRDGVEALAGTPLLRTLRHLDLRYASLGDDGLTALLERDALTSVRQLSLQKNELTTKGLARLAGAPLPSLRELDLRFNAVGPEGAVALSKASFAPALERLFLNADDVGLDGVRVLARAPALPSALRRMWSAR